MEFRLLNSGQNYIFLCFENAPKMEWIPVFLSPLYATRARAHSPVSLSVLGCGWDGEEQREAGFSVVAAPGSRTLTLGTSGGPHVPRPGRLGTCSELGPGCSQGGRAGCASSPPALPSQIQFLSVRSSPVFRTVGVRPGRGGEPPKVCKRAGRRRLVPFPPGGRLWAGCPNLTICRSQRSRVKYSLLSSSLLPKRDTDPCLSFPWPSRGQV